MKIKISHWIIFGFGGAVALASVAGAASKGVQKGGKLYTKMETKLLAAPAGATMQKLPARTAVQWQGPVSGQKGWQSVEVAGQKGVLPTAVLSPEAPPLNLVAYNGNGALAVKDISVAASVRALGGSVGQAGTHVSPEDAEKQLRDLHELVKSQPSAGGAQ